MDIKEKRDVVILGAGLAGLSLGWNITRLPVAATILEKEAQIGGLYRTIEQDGFRLDLGPHNIHTSKEDILRFLMDNLGEDLREISYCANIYFNRQFVEYPLKGIRALKVLKKNLVLPAVWDLFFARLCMFLRNPSRDDSFEDWIKNRFGKTLYNIYFGPYAQKAWKIPASSISAYVAAKRVPIISLTDLVRKVFNRPPKAFHGEDVSQVRSFYPRLGAGQVADLFASGFVSNGGGIRTGATIKAIRHDDCRIVSVVHTVDGVETELPVDFMFSTIPLDELVRFLDPAPPQAVLEAAESLDYSSERLLYITVNKPDVFNVPLVYFQDPGIEFNRVYDIRRFSKDCVPEGKNALNVEFTCSRGDATWNSDDRTLFETAITVLERESILSRKCVDNYFSQSLTHAYPRFRIGFQGKLKTIFDYLNTFRNAVSLGRQGLFCYANGDDVMDMSFRASDFFINTDLKGVDYYSLFDSYVRHIVEY